MALPNALAQRLLKRGIIKTPTSQKPSEEVEEVFAESYDEPNESNKLKDKKDEFDFDKIPDCPNRTNQYHQCTDYCAKKYGFKKFQPHPVFEKRRTRMLKIYPLLPNWLEVPDINANRYYYWNTETNQVSWLSPSCPKAKFEYSKRLDKLPEPPAAVVTKGIDRLRPISISQKSLQENLDEFVEEIDQFSEGRDAGSKYHNQPPQPVSNRQDRHHYNKKTRLSDKADPMDPSSYSNVPRGKWSAGLEGASAKDDF